MEELLKLHADQVLANDEVVNVEVDGCVLTHTYPPHRNAILDFEVRDTDVWVCSFPKSGTTWTQEMVWLISNNLDFKGASVNLVERFTFLEFTAVFRSKKYGRVKQLDGIMDDLRNMKSRRFFKSHLPWQLLPKQIQNGSKKPKIIYITRDPRDVCVSYYHHNRLWGRITYDFDKFCEVFLADKVEWQPFWNHVFGFWKRRNQDNILFLRYEELKEDLPCIIKKVAGHLQVQLTEDDVNKLTKHLSFAKMKDNNAVNLKEYAEIFRERQYTSYTGEFMRAGSSGSYKTWMTPEIIEKFNEWTRQETAGTDFSFYTHYKCSINE